MRQKCPASLLFHLFNTIFTGSPVREWQEYDINRALRFRVFTFEGYKYLREKLKYSA